MVTSVTLKGIPLPDSASFEPSYIELIHGVYMQGKVHKGAFPKKRYKNI